MTSIKHGKLSPAGASKVRLPAATALFLLATAAAFAYQVYGRIGEKYATLGGPNGVLGQPTSDEADAPFGGRFNTFERGYIYWHPQIGTAYGVWGAIGARWDQAGRTQYGYPITDELATPDGRGRYNHFRAMQMGGRPESSIYWTPQTGAHVVYGEIRKAWAQAGWERSIGYPTSDEFQWGSYRRSNFEQGYIYWTGHAAQLVHSGEAILQQTPPNTFGTILVTGLELAIDDRPYAGNSTLLSENTLCLEYEKRRGEMAEYLKNLIRAEAGRRMGRFGIHSNARMNLSTHCSFRADVATMGATSIRLRTYLPGNVFNFHVTTPTVFGSWADPALSMSADIWAETVVSIPDTPAGNISVGPTHIAMSRPKLDSHNLTGDVLLAVRGAYQYFTGTDLAAQLTQSRTFDYPLLQRSLADLSPQLRRIPGNYRIETTVAPGNIFRINGTGRPLPPPPNIH